MNSLVGCSWVLIFFWEEFGVKNKVDVWQTKPPEFTSPDRNILNIDGRIYQNKALEFGRYFP